MSWSGGSPRASRADDKVDPRRAEAEEEISRASRPRPTRAGTELPQRAAFRARGGRSVPRSALAVETGHLLRRVAIAGDVGGGDRLLDRGDLGGR